jgi:hypothetical protein
VQAVLLGREGLLTPQASCVCLLHERYVSFLLFSPMNCTGESVAVYLEMLFSSKIPSLEFYSRPTFQGNNSTQPSQFFKEKPPVWKDKKLPSGHRQISHTVCLDPQGLSNP